jgi:PBSX family phage terminase large subunit
MIVGSSSTPSFERFNPKDVKYQYKVLHDWDHKYRWDLGVQEILLSGSVGSAKSLLMAHIVWRHLLTYKGARICLGRRSLPDLKDTIFQKILEHAPEALTEGKHYWVNESRAKIKLFNGSEIISKTWGDRKAAKSRSLELSGLVIEELTENDENDAPAIQELRMRVGRLPHIKENFYLAATNPDSPAHWAYKYFIETKTDTRYVYYSKTTDNKFLPDWYITQLKESLDSKIAKRMIDGEWIEIAGEVVYYEYDKEQNFLNKEYEINLREPIRITFDFNIGEGKPMSCAIGQRVGKKSHWFDEAVVEGARTLDIMEELAGKDLFEHKLKFIVHGDATGRARSTNSLKSNYDQIRDFLSNFKRADGTSIDFEMQVSSANPPIKTRHNILNGRICNANGERNLFVYKKAKTLDEGFRLTKLKPGGNYIEDDSKAYQHITTAVGYAEVEINKREKLTPQRTIDL